MEVVLMVVAVPVGGGGAGGGGGARLAHKPCAHIYKRPNLQTLSLLSPTPSSSSPLSRLIVRLTRSDSSSLSFLPSLFRSYAHVVEVPPMVSLF